MNAVVYELGKDCDFTLTPIDLTTLGSVTTPATSTVQQKLSRVVDSQGVQTEWGRLSRLNFAINPDEVELSGMDDFLKNWQDAQLDWEVGLIGIRRMSDVNQGHAVGMAQQTLNPLTEIWLDQLVNSFGNPTKPTRRAMLVCRTVDRIWTFYGKLGRFNWDLMRDASNDSLILRPINIGLPNPSYVIRTGP